MENLYNLIFPKSCVLCKTRHAVLKKVYGPKFVLKDAIAKSENALLCSDCLAWFKVLNNSNCIVCDKPTIDGKTHKLCASEYSPEATLGIYEYAGFVRLCIKEAKFGSKHFEILKEISTNAANNLLQSGVRDLFEYNSAPIIVPVPPSKSKLKKRGFNQAELIAEIFAKHFKLEINSGLLKRNIDTYHQYGLTRRNRYKNVQDAFSATADSRGKEIILVDDIWTTGATLLETAKAMKKSGATKVYCLALSKKPLKIRAKRHTIYSNGRVYLSRNQNSKATTMA